MTAKANTPKYDKQSYFLSSHLYTVIPYGEGPPALKHCFGLRTVKEPSSETLLRVAELVLTLNCFSVADNYETNQWFGHGYQNGTRIHQSSVTTLTTVSALLLLTERN